jgi:hypothetical protein
MKIVENFSFYPLIRLDRILGLDERQQAAHRPTSSALKKVMEREWRGGEREEVDQVGPPLPS